MTCAYPPTKEPPVSNRSDAGTRLSVRDQLSLVNAHIPVSVNPALAANVRPDGSIEPEGADGPADLGVQTRPEQGTPAS